MGKTVRVTHPLGFALLLAVQTLASSSAAQSYDPDDIATQVAKDEEAEYLTVLMSQASDATDLCVQAGIVAQAYLAADNARKYDIWKKNERGWCKRAGSR